LTAAQEAFTTAADFLNVPAAHTMVSYVCVLVMHCPFTTQPRSFCIWLRPTYASGGVKLAILPGVVKFLYALEL
jgi:hypothetical protein